FGHEYVFAGVRQSWGEDRVFFLDDEGGQHSMPVGWTDVAGPDVFVAMAEGRAAFRVCDLIVLARMIEHLSDGDGSRPVRQISPQL
ncbi:MAG: Y4bD/Y4pK family protein, partial [Actinomycetota bacterium]|nr:Y4bD/Y4pK family protein [Actinomycetota bacterium]